MISARFIIALLVLIALASLVNCGKPLSLKKRAVGGLDLKKRAVEPDSPCPSDSICCGFKTYKKADGYDQCCGGKGYNSSKQYCCKQGLFFGTISDTPCDSKK